MFYIFFLICENKQFESRNSQQLRCKNPKICIVLLWISLICSVTVRSLEIVISRFNFGCDTKFFVIIFIRKKISTSDPQQNCVTELADELLKYLITTYPNFLICPAIFISQTSQLPLRGHYTRMLCHHLIHVWHSQNSLIQSE